MVDQVLNTMYMPQPGEVRTQKHAHP